MKDRILWVIASLFLAAGSFFLGIGIAGFTNKAAENDKTNNDASSYESINPHELDLRNAVISKNMNYISLEKELVFEDTDSWGYAGIANGTESQLGCTLKLIQDETGDIIYQSKLLDPGYYIENIRLSADLKKGYYSCTAVWDFYDKETDCPIGSMASKAVVIIKE